MGGGGRGYPITFGSEGYQLCVSFSFCCFCIEKMVKTSNFLKEEIRMTIYL